jgi:tetratricopeptide (TPR) repeat protein
MISFRLIAILSIALFVSVPALADDWADCAGSDPDRSTIACTRIIQADGGDVDRRRYPRVLRCGDRGSTIEALQSFMASQGYDPGKIDGVYGSVTHRALLAFQANQGRVSVKDIIIRSIKRSDVANAYRNRGYAYAEKGGHDRAIADYGQALRLDPDNAAVYYNRGNAHAAKGDLGKALIDFRIAARLIPETDPWQKRAMTRIAEIEKELASVETTSYC